MNDESLAHRSELALPLQGIGVLVTREVKQAAALSSSLRELGAKVAELPVLEFRLPDDTSVLDRALGTIDQYQWIIFASTNAIDFAVRRLADLGRSKDALRSCKIATIGARTAEHLQASLGWEPNFIPTKYIAESFVDEFVAASSLRGQRILWPRSTKGRIYIKEALEKVGAIVDMVFAYETDKPEERNGVLSVAQMLRRNELQYIVITSSEAAKNFVEMMAEAEGSGEKVEESSSLIEFVNGVTLCSIGEQTTTTLRSLISGRVIQPDQFTIPALIECLLADVRTAKTIRR